MAKLFSNTTKVIHHDPSVPNQMVLKNQRLWLLIPTIAYKVYVPHIMEKPFNLFEETIMKLLIASYKTPSYIAERLLLSEELVSFILSDLKERQYLDEYCKVTEKGNMALNEVVEPDQYKIGYIFYNPLENDFWDVFIESDKLNFIDAPFTMKQQYYRIIELGKIGETRPTKAFQLPSSLTDIPVVPSNLEIIKVLRNHNKRLRFERTQMDKQSDISNDNLPSKINAVQYLEEAFPVYVTTFTYMPKNISNERQRKICHPFGKGSSQSLQEQMTKEVAKLPALRERLIKFNEGFKASEVELEDQKNADAKEAMHYFNELFSSQLDAEFPELYDLLFDYYQTHKRIQASLGSSNKGAINEKLQGEIAQYTVQSVQLLESVMAHMLNSKVDSYKDSVDPVKYLVDNQAENAKILSDIAIDLGFVETRIDDDRFFENFDDVAINHSQLMRVFEKFFRLGIGHVAYAKENGSLKSLVARHLLLAKDDVTHPFHEISAIMPRFILKLEQLLLKRNAFAHITDQSNYLKSLDELFAFTLTILGMLLNKPIQTDKLKKITKYGEHQQFVNLQAHRYSQQSVELAYGLEIRNYKSLYNSLVDVHYFASYRSNQYVLECSSAVEALLNEMLGCCKLVMNKELLQHTGKKTIDKLTPFLEKTGFKWEPETFPTSFSEAKMTRVKRTQMVLEAVRNEVISAKLYALLISLASEQQLFFKELEQASPSFFEKVMRLSDVRAHGNKKLSAEQCVELKNDVFQVYQEVFQIIVHHKLKEVEVRQ